MGNFMEEVFGKEGKKVNYYYSQIPFAVWSCKTLSDSAVRLYAAYHSFCKYKKIELGKSMTFVSQCTLAELLGWSIKKVRRQQQLLEKEGFVSVKYSGQMSSNKIYLNIIQSNEIPDDD